MCFHYLFRGVANIPGSSIDGKLITFLHILEYTGIRILIFSSAMSLCVYFRSHLEIYAALQRLGLISSPLWLPRPSFFLPFSEHSPIPSPPPLEGFDPASLLRWAGGAVISATPFILWTMSRRITINWKSKLWQLIYPQLPNTYMLRQKFPSPLPPPPPASTPHTLVEEHSDPQAVPREPEDMENEIPHTTNRSRASSQPGLDGRSQHEASSPIGDEYGSDEEDNPPGVSATMISFDVEATDAADAPPGLWSAELRPSQADSKSSSPPGPTYFDTLLTRAPPLVATDVLTELVSRIVCAPFEATALRVMARTWAIRHGLPLWPILTGDMMSGLNLTYAVNFLISELLHLGALSDLWALFAFACQQLHMSEEEWKESEADLLREGLLATPI